MGMASQLGKAITPQARRFAPELTANFVHEALHRAIHGVGPLPPAARAADRILGEHRGNVDRAIHDVIEKHIRFAGLQGFATNIGGAITATVAIPANITGLAVLECRMVAAIAHLRGYDLADPRVKNAVLACVVGEDQVKKLVKAGRLPSTPMGIATAPVHDPHLDRVVAAEVTSELIGRVAGKRVVSTTVRRIPFLGGFIGAGADGFTTWQVGRYADRELRPRTQR